MFFEEAEAEVNVIVTDKRGSWCSTFLRYSFLPDGLIRG